MVNTVVLKAEQAIELVHQNGVVQNIAKNEDAGEFHRLTIEHVARHVSVKWVFDDAIYSCSIERNGLVVRRETTKIRPSWSDNG